jgi:hypothetical protein
MIWLQSNDKYDDLARYDHRNGTFTIVSRKTLDVNEPISTNGFFAMLSNIFVALYNFEQQLFLRIGDKRIPLTDDTIALVSGDASNRQLVVDKTGKEIAHLSYILDDSNQFPDDPTPFIKDEDFDFGLFISNISKNGKRKKVLLGLD